MDESDGMRLIRNCFKPKVIVVCSIRPIIACGPDWPHQQQQQQQPTHLLQPSMEGSLKKVACSMADSVWTRVDARRRSHHSCWYATDMPHSPELQRRQR